MGQNANDNDVQIALNPTNKGHSAVVGNDAFTEAAGTQTFKVGLTTLDAMLEQEPGLKNVLLAKVDIEGNEGRLFEGGQTFFSTHAPCILHIELNPDFLINAGTSLDKVKEQIRGFGYVQKSMSGYDYIMHQEDQSACFARVAAP